MPGPVSVWRNALQTSRGSRVDSWADKAESKRQTGAERTRLGSGRTEVTQEAKTR